MTEQQAKDGDAEVPVIILSSASLESWLPSQDEFVSSWVRSNEFGAKPGSFLSVPGSDGMLAVVLAGVSAPKPGIWDLAGLPEKLPAGLYRIDPGAADVTEDDLDVLALGWLLGSYRFDRFKKSDVTYARLSPPTADSSNVDILAEATVLVRNLINMPANEMGPSQLAEAASELAGRYGADVTVTVGEDLLAENYPAIHAVGRAAENAPRLIEMSWGDESNPTIALVGKGVCFDSGGLGIKPASGMKLMKKDMGGAANILGMAMAVMALELNVHLKVLIPAVENAIAGNAMRPLDVVQTRAGKTIEIGHTDAEGRVILADALTRALEHEPELIVDFATLTGAARVALGTELPALFCNNEELATQLLSAGGEIEDPLWRMPLWAGYRKMVEGKSADITNSPEGGYGGAITAALFLEHFVSAEVPWAHVDLMAWNLSSKPGRPEGGEAMGMRAFTEMLRRRFG